MLSVPDSLPAIGLFDSGVGGLSVMREVMRLLPGHPLIYLGDQANAPYGQRSLAEVRHLAGSITDFLLGQGASLIVVACNTASAAALHWLRQRYPQVPFVGMEPAVKPAAARTRTGHVGVIATAATFQGELFASLMDRFGRNVVVHTQVCPELVSLVEAGELNSERARWAVREYLTPLLNAGVDELVLGCTHYPFLRSLIEEVVGPDVEVIDPAPAVACQVARVLMERAGEMRERAIPVTPRFFTTGDPWRFQAAIQALLGLDVWVEQAMWRAGRVLALGRAG